MSRVSTNKQTNKQNITTHAWPNSQDGRLTITVRRGGQSRAAGAADSNARCCIRVCDIIAGAAHGLRQSSRHVPHAQYGGYVSQILGVFAACSYFMGMRRLALPRPRARVPSWDEVINIHVMEHHYARLDNIPCQAGG